MGFGPSKDVKSLVVGSILTAIYHWIIVKKTMILPNFLIIGAAKSGTTSLWHYLNQHPDIYLSHVKEPRFFTPEFYIDHCHGPLRDNARLDIVTLEEYYQLFNRVENELAIGEASTEYLFFPETAARIKELIPSVKLIAILRNPAERAFSAFCYQHRDSCESLSFRKALSDEDNRIRQKWRPGWLYLKSGYYYEQLKRYYEIFDESQIHIYLYEDLDLYTEKTVKDIFRFLGVDENFTPNLSRKNISKTPRNSYLNYLLRRDNLFKRYMSNILSNSIKSKLSTAINNINLSIKKEMTLETRLLLSDLYTEDILKLQNLINRDLSQWIM